MDYYVIPIFLLVYSSIQLIIKPGRNAWFGYRSPGSYKSEHTWAFANAIVFKSIFTLGLVGTSLGIFATELPLNTETVNLIALGISICIIAIVEILIYQKFDKEGNPR